MKKSLTTLCSIAIAIKTATGKQQAFVNLIQRMKNAPDGVGAPSGAMKPDNPVKSSFACIIADSGRKAKHEL